MKGLGLRGLRSSLHLLLQVLQLAVADVDLGTCFACKPTSHRELTQGTCREPGSINASSGDGSESLASRIATRTRSSAMSVPACLQGRGLQPACKPRCKPRIAMLAVKSALKARPGRWRQVLGRRRLHLWRCGRLLSCQAQRGRWHGAGASHLGDQRGVRPAKDFASRSERMLSLGLR